MAKKTLAAAVKKTRLVSPAVNLADAYRALEKDLDDDSLYDAYYVERKHSPAGRLKAALDVGDRSCKVLFSGQNKSGKTTELLRLERELGDSHLVVFLSVLRDLEPSDVKPVDVLLLALVKLTECATRHGVRLGRDLTNLVRDLLEQSTSEVFRTRVTEKAGGGKVGVGLPVWVAELGANLRIDTTLRTEVRKRLEPRVSGLVEALDLVAATVRSNSGREPLIIVDDMEKLDLDVAEHLFYKNAATLTRPDCRMIYTFHKALEYLPVWTAVRNSFHGAEEVYPVRIADRKGEPHAEGRALLRAIITRRMSEELFEPDVLDDVVTRCNGVLSDLLGLCRNACLTALEQNVPRITAEMVERQAIELTIHYQRMMEADLYPLAESVARTRTADRDEKLSKLLHMLAVIEYRDETGIYYDVHPAVRRLLGQRKPA